MSSPRPKVNPPLCGICMSSSDVRQEPDGGWHCRKHICRRQRTYKPIMVTEIEKDEPVSPGLLNRLWTFLTRDIDDDRRPKHPRPAPPRPQPPRPAPREGEGYRPRSSGDGPRCGPPKRSTARPLQKCSVCGRSEKVERAADGNLYCGDRPCRRKTNMKTGGPPRGGSGALPAPPPDCIYCEVGRVEEISKPNAFEIGRYHCKACDKEFTEEDVIKAKKTPVEKTTDAVKAIAQAARTMGMSVAEATHAFERLSQTININVAGFVGNEAELVKALEESLEEPDDLIDPDDLEETLDSDEADELEEAEQQVGLHKVGKIPTEKSWSKLELEKARETSSAWWWTATKWIIGVGASIGLGWLAEWAFF